MSGKPPMRGRAARLARLLPTGPASAARTPFVLLVVVLLGGGLIALLLLNSSLSQGSFRLSKLKRETTELTDQQQELQREVDGNSAPGNLERRARELGMVPGGNPAFIDPDGKIRGTTDAAPAAPRPPSPANSAPPPSGSPAAGASAGASVAPSGSPGGSPSVPPSGSPSGTPAAPSARSASTPAAPASPQGQSPAPTPSTTAR